VTQETLAPQSEGRRIVIAFIVAFAFIMQGSDTTVLTIAIPTIAASLGVSPLMLHLAVTGYLVSLAVFMPVSGWFADRFGMRRVLCASLIVFSGSSILCALSPNLEWLVAARILQGFGGAMMTPVGRLIVLRAFGPGRTLDAMTYLTMPVIVGPLIGPLLGATIISVASWRWIFVINIPICLLVVTLLQIFVPKDRPLQVQHRFDFKGFFMAGAALVLFQLGVEHMSYPLAGPTGTIALFAGSMLMLVIYYRHAQNTVRPALELSLFGIRAFAVGVVGGGIGRIGLNSTTFLLPLLLQLGLGMNPIEAAAYSSTAALGAFAAKAFLRRSVARFGFGNVVAVLAVAGALLMACFALTETSTPIVLLVTCVIMLGAIRSMYFNAVNGLTYSEVPDAMLSRSVSSAGVFQQLSMGLGVSAAAAVLGLLTQPGATPDLPEFTEAFLIMSVVPLLSIPFMLSLARSAAKSIEETADVSPPVVSK